jgi:hypothetical protein
VLAVNQAGRAYGRNDNVEINPLNPDLKGADWASLSDTVLNLISGGSRYPVYRLGSGGDANLATATAQGGPTYQGFKTRQGVVRRFMERILKFVIDQAVMAGKLPLRIQPLDDHGEPQVDKQGAPVFIQSRDAFTIVMPESSRAIRRRQLPPSSTSSAP